jgi:hypothetical protein
VPSFPTDPNPSRIAAPRRKGGALGSNSEDDDHTAKVAATNTNASKRTTATRVVKKFAPTQAGALKLARRYGAALVCVRHRHDLEGNTRFTTVELVVEQVPIGKMRQSVGENILNIHVAPTEYELKRRMRAHGGVWDHHTYTWLLSRTVAKQLGLLGRVIKTLP